MDSAIQRLNNWGQELISVAHDTGEVKGGRGWQFLTDPFFALKGTKTISIGWVSLWKPSIRLLLGRWK